MEFAILGPLRVSHGGEPLDVGPPKQRAVLALLLIGANRVVSLDRLIDELWGDTPPPRAIGALQVYISNLRRVLEPDRFPGATPSVLVTQNPGYSLLIDPAAFDAARFEAGAALGRRLLATEQPAAARRELEPALALWRGPALADFSSQSFARPEVARLDELRLEATENRVAADLALGADRELVAELEALLAKDPLRERPWGLLMLALYRAQRQADALRAFQRARQKLADELGIDPSPALCLLEHDILVQASSLEWQPPREQPVAVTGRTTTSKGELEERATGPANPPLVGRDEPLVALTTALNRSRQGLGQIVLVSGEPGIGKTRLVEELAEGASARGVAVSWGTCQEGDEAPSFWPWVQVVRGLLACSDEALVGDSFSPSAPHIARIVPEIKALNGVDETPSPPEADTARFALFEALSESLLRFSRRQPLLVVVDDLHWADPPSLQLLSFLAPRIRTSSLLLVGTFRDTEGSAPLTDALAELARYEVGERVRLAGLDGAAVASFMAATTGAPVAPTIAQAVWARTEGNPFFVSELARLLLSEGTLGTGQGPTETVPAGVRDVVRRRVRRLPVPAQTVLVTASVVGREFDLDVLEAACGLGLDQTLESVEAALMSGIVLEDRRRVGRFRFSHALVREAIAEEMSAMRRARLHATVGQAIEDLCRDQAGDDQILALAHHFLEAVPAGHEEKAFRYAIAAAAIDTARLAFESAEGHLDRALELTRRRLPGNQRHQEELDVLRKLTMLLTMTHGYGYIRIEEAAARALDLCRRTGESSQELLALMRLAEFHCVRADFPPAEQAARELLAAREGYDGLPFLVGGSWMSGMLALHQGKLQLAEESLTRAITSAASLPPLPGDWGEVYGQNPATTAGGFLACVASLRGNPNQSRQLIGEALDRARTRGRPFDQAFTLFVAAWVAAFERDAAAGRYAAEGVELAGRHGFALFAAMSGVIQGWGIARNGYPQAGVEAMRESLGRHDATGARMLRHFFLALLADALILGGDYVGALAAVERGLVEVGTTNERFYEAELHRLRGEVLALSARPDTAEESLRRAVAVAREQGALLLERRASASLATLLNDIDPTVDAVQQDSANDAF